MTENWNSKLLDCTADFNSCCYGFWCCPCLACSVAEDMKENRLLPLCDICSPAVLSGFGIPLVPPPAALALRVSIRNKYGIQGSLFNDISATCICMWCSWCQMHRELKHRNSQSPVNLQPK